MYILTGLAVWVVLLFVILIVLKFGGYVWTDKTEWSEAVADLAQEFRDAPIHSVGIFGIASVIIIGIWPLTVAILALAVSAFVVGGIPYFLFTRGISKPKQEM